MTMDNKSFAGMLAKQADDFANQCIHCGECLSVCPAFPLTAHADMGPEYVMESITDFLETGDISDAAYDMVFSCTEGCSHHCATACPEGLMPNLVFMHAISKIRQSGKELPAYVYQYNPEHRFKFSNVFSALQDKPSDKRLIDEVPPDPEPVDVVFFGGCSMNGMPHLMAESMGILDSMGVQFAALDSGKRCCGVGHIVCGEAEKSQGAGENLVADIAAFRPKQAVFYCLGCYLVVAGTLSMFMETPFAPIDLTSYLVDNLDRIPFKNSLDRKIAFHDSCVLSAMPDFAEKPRRLLDAIPGISRVELKHNRKNATCCGGTTKSMRPHIADKMRKDAMKEGEDAGIQTMTTFCGGCHESFSPHENEYSFDVKNYISLIAESVGVGHEDRFKKYAGYRDLKQILTEAGECIERSGFTVEEMERILPEYLHHLLPGDSE